MAASLTPMLSVVATKTNTNSTNEDLMITGATYIGSYQVAANHSKKGDVIRITAAGLVENSTAAAAPYN